MKIQYSHAEWNRKPVLLGETEQDETRTMNLLIGFHGAGSTPENMLIHGNKLELKNTLMVFPQGPVDAGKGLWSWWKDGPGQSESVIGFVDFTTGMIGEANKLRREKFPERESRLCLWGFSQGAAAVLVYALMGSEPIHKAASICGFLPELPETAPRKSATRVLGIFGANDDVVPSFLAEHALEEMQNRGLNTVIKETTQGHEVTSENLQEVSGFFAG